MTHEPASGKRIVGSLRSADGVGIVRVEDRFSTDIENLWSALTDPARLALWLGDVEGDLRPGGEFRARFHATGWEGTGRIDACEPPHRLVVTTREPGDSGEVLVTLTLAGAGDETVLVAEERGIPLPILAAYGAGEQVHMEDLADHVAGRERRELGTRWQELLPLYQALAAKVTSAGDMEPRGT